MDLYGYIHVRNLDPQESILFVQPEMDGRQAKWARGTQRKSPPNEQQKGL